MKALLAFALLALAACQTTPTIPPAGPGPIDECTGPQPVGHPCQ